MREGTKEGDTVTVSSVEEEVQKKAVGNCAKLVLRRLGSALGYPGLSFAPRALWLYPSEHPLTRSSGLYLQSQVVLNRTVRRPITNAIVCELDGRSRHTLLHLFSIASTRFYTILTTLRSVRNHHARLRSFSDLLPPAFLSQYHHFLYQIEDRNRTRDLSLLAPSCFEGDPPATNLSRCCLCLL